MQFQSALPIFMLIFITAVQPAWADSVWLDNGDRISGRVLHKGNGILTMETDYAETIKINWDRVTAIETEQAVDVVRQGGDGLEQVRITAAGGIAPAQIEYINPAPEESGLGVSYKGRFNVSAAQTSGNSQTGHIYADGEFSGIARDYRYTILGNLRRENDSAARTAQSWLLSGNRDHMLGERGFVYARSSFEHDLFKDFDLRATVGGGLGLQLLDSPQASLSLRGGLDLVRLDLTTGEDETYPALGWGVKYSQWLWSRSLELFHEQDGYMNLRDTGQVTLRTRTGLRAPIAGGFSVNSQINVDWEREPADGRKAADVMFLMGVGYDW